MSLVVRKIHRLAISLNALDELPGERLGEVFDFVMFIKQRKQAQPDGSTIPVLRAAPIQQLKKLIGLVSWGGDAMADTERLYEA